MFRKSVWSLLALLLSVPVTAAAANVITDWDEKAVGFVQTKMPPPAGYRVMAIVHLAMFEAVNSIEPHYKPYKAKLSASADTSKEAAAAAALRRTYARRNSRPRPGQGRRQRAGRRRKWPQVAAMNSCA